MYGDTDVIRSLATVLDDRADEVEVRANQLRDRAEACIWQGLAAQAMRTRASDSYARMIRCADAHREAAAALRTHAAKVDDTLALIGQIEKRARALVASVRERVGGIVDAVSDLLPGDRVLLRFDPPAPGHAAWLDVRLPGLGR